jgi:hypothetical protein
MAEKKKSKVQIKEQETIEDVPGLLEATTEARPSAVQVRQPRQAGKVVLSSAGRMEFAKNIIRGFKRMGGPRVEINEMFRNTGKNRTLSITKLKAFLATTAGTLWLDDLINLAESSGQTPILLGSNLFTSRRMDLVSPILVERVVEPPSQRQALPRGQPTTVGTSVIASEVEDDITPPATSPEQVEDTGMDIKHTKQNIPLANRRTVIDIDTSDESSSSISSIESTFQAPLVTSIPAPPLSERKAFSGQEIKIRGEVFDRKVADRLVNFSSLPEGVRGVASAILQGQDLKTLGMVGAGLGLQALWGLYGRGSIDKELTNTLFNKINLGFLAFGPSFKRFFNRIFSSGEKLPTIQIAEWQDEIDGEDDEEMIQAEDNKTKIIITELTKEQEEEDKAREEQIKQAEKEGRERAEIEETIKKQNEPIRQRRINVLTGAVVGAGVAGGANLLGLTEGSAISNIISGLTIGGVAGGIAGTAGALGGASSVVQTALSGGIGAVGGAFTSEFIPPLPAEPQRLVHQTNEKEKGTLRPKFIVPSTSILDVPPEEVQADMDEWTAFDFVQPTSEGPIGNVKTNPLKRMNMVENKIIMSKGGIDLHSEYGQPIPTNAEKITEQFIGPVLAPVVLPEMKFGLSEFEEQPYRWNPTGDLAIGVADPYRDLTKVLGLNEQIQRSVLFGEVI